MPRAKRSSSADTAAESVGRRIRERRDQRALTLAELAGRTGLSLAFLSRLVLEGEFRIAGKLYGPGTMLYHPDPHYEDELHTDTGGVMLIVQYPGPATGGRPIYDKRFNMKERRAVAEERTDL